MCLEASEYIGLNEAMNEVDMEIKKAIASYPTMRSEHEGFAILLEEVDELKAEVWKKPEFRDKTKLRAEAKQIAAMAIRFMVDLC